MRYYNLLLSLSMISISNLIKHVSALTAEDIVGGLIAEQHNFKYQVAILGRQNLSILSYLLGNGVIISEQFILSAAKCFMYDSQILMNFRFSIVAGSSDLRSMTGMHVDIDKIYTFFYQPSYEFNNIAAAKLIIGLDFLHNVFLSSIGIPNLTESFLNRDAVVSGYGYSEFENVIDPFSGDIVVAKKIPDLKLRHTEVNIGSINKCAKSFKDINQYTQLCGITKVVLGNKTGLCSKDVGSPLIIDNKVVGVASLISAECDDTIYGAVYTKVSAYQEFIQNAMGGFSLNSLQIHQNRLHIPPFW